MLKEFGLLLSTITSVNYQFSLNYTVGNYKSFDTTLCSVDIQVFNMNVPTQLYRLDCKVYTAIRFHNVNGRLRLNYSYNFGYDLFEPVSANDYVFDEFYSVYSRDAYDDIEITYDNLGSVYHSNYFYSFDYYNKTYAVQCSNYHFTDNSGTYNNTTCNIFNPLDSYTGNSYNYVEPTINNNGEIVTNGSLNINHFISSVDQAHIYYNESNMVSNDIEKTMFLMAINGRSELQYNPRIKYTMIRKDYNLDLITLNSHSADYDLVSYKIPILIEPLRFGSTQPLIDYYNSSNTLLNNYNDLNSLYNEVVSDNPAGGVFSLFAKVFNGIGSFLSIEIAPYITLGMLLSIPIIVALIMGVIKLIGG